ncbi:MAG: ABC transporter permease [Alphaproteobacteria bacterium]|nr:ABC transporter permease [Alphaproteobacteria bacterium]MBF0374200.1 ABC transporter permease [Alphaproteobacteria bacterium]
MKIRHPGWLPLAPFNTFLWHRPLILRLAAREVAARYRGSLMGALWAVAVPLMMLTVYSFVFGVVFRARWSGTSDAKEFPVVLFAGLVCFWMFSESATRAPSLIRENAVYVKKIVFPVYVLPWVPMLSALFNAAIGLGILVAGRWVLVGPPPVTTLFAPLILLPLALMTMGIAWVFASIGMYVRDLGHIVGVLVSAMMFLSPIFYPPEAVPEAFRQFLQFSPLTVPVEQLRAVVVWGNAPDWTALGLYSLAAWAVAWAGLSWFLKTQKGFADVV